MQGTPNILEVTPHIVRLGSTIYQISNICSASAYQYKGTFKDLMLIVLPAMWGWAAAKLSLAAGAPFFIFSVAYLIYLSSLMSRYSLHIEVSSGSSDLFYTNNRAFLMNIVSSIEHSMVYKGGQTYTYNIRDERIVIGHIDNAGHIENIGNVAYGQTHAGPTSPGNHQEHLYPQRPGHT